jgi:3-oxoacyl-[acyl-carrier protein] reductase
MDLKDKKVIVTGGASGIGKCLAGKLVENDASVGVFDINKEALDRLSEEYPDVYCRVCDISEARQVEEAVNDFFEKFQAIDALVNNAGIIHSSLLVGLSKGKVAGYDVDMWNKTIAANLSSVFYMTSSVVQKMLIKRTRGVIINVSSISASGNAGQSAYSAAKAGVNALTVTWAKELGLLGIRVAGIAPGFTQTETTMQSMTQNVLNEWKKKTPLRRFAGVDEIADGIMFILKNDFFNGRVLELDGGLRI